MKHFVVAGLLGICGLCGQAGALVVSGNITVGAASNIFSNYGGAIDQLPTHNQDGTGVFFNFTPANSSAATLQCVNTVLDEGSDWYLASLGQTFSHSTLGQFQFLPPVNGIPVGIPAGNFYLAVSTGRGFTANQPNRDVFGWVELNNTGTALVQVDSAVAYGESGIVVGVAGAGAEPGSLGVLGVGVLWMLRRNGRGGKTVTE